MTGGGPQVVVVGAGPVGLIMAGLLGRQGLSVLLVERDHEAGGQPRAIAADDVMLRVLRSLPGLEAVVRQMLGPVPVRVQDHRGRRITNIDFGMTELGAPGLAFFHQPALERGLHEALKALSTVSLRRGVEVTGLAPTNAGVQLTMASGEVVSTGYVVGCDGAGSTVRRLLGVPYTGRTAAQRWLVIDADTDRPLSDHFSYRVDPARPSVSLPRPGGHRWEFMLRPGEDPVTLTRGAGLKELIAPDVAGAEIRLLRAADYTFHTRLASRWRQGRVLLAGDAAHCMPPFAGQGLGAGVRDASALAWRLAEVIGTEVIGGRSAADLLDGYEAERRPDVRAMIRTARIAGALLQTTSPARAAATRCLLRSIDAAPIAGPWFRRGGLRPRPAGRALPNPVVSTAGGPRRLDELLGVGWALLVPPGDGSVPDQLRGRDFTRLTVSAGPGTTVQDLDGELLALIDRAGGRLVVRPDRYLS